MKNAEKTLICAAGCIALALAARAAVGPVSPPAEKETPANTLSSDNPYGAIVERNIFDLHDPPPPKEEKKETPPPANIKLNGITTIFGNKQALFMVTEKAEAGKTATSRSLILAEGQRSGVLEVLEINPKARTARIKNDDIESVINIETNKTAASGGPAPAPTAGGMPGAHAPPGAVPHGGFNPGGGGNLPARPVRETPQSTAVPQPAYGGGLAYGGGAVAPQQQYQPVPQQQSLTPEEQYTLIEAARTQSQAGVIDPNLARILPPTPFSQPNPQASSGEPTPSAPPAPPAPVPGTRGSGTLAVP